MQIPINKDIRRYQEEIFMGLTLRQLLCSGIAIGLAVLIYLWAKPLLGQETASWLCILAAAPIAAAGVGKRDSVQRLAGMENRTAPQTKRKGEEDCV